MKNSGKIFKLIDGRKVIVYDDQPILNKNKVLLHLVDENYELIMNENDKPKTIFKNYDDLLNELKKASFVGFVD